MRYKIEEFGISQTNTQQPMNTHKRYVSQISSSIQTPNNALEFKSSSRRRNHVRPERINMSKMLTTPSTPFFGQSSLEICDRSINNSFILSDERNIKLSPREQYVDYQMSPQLKKCSTLGSHEFSLSLQSQNMRISSVLSQRSWNAQPKESLRIFRRNKIQKYIGNHRTRSILSQISASKNQQIHQRTQQHFYNNYQCLQKLPKMIPSLQNLRPTKLKIYKGIERQNQKSFSPIQRLKDKKNITEQYSNIYQALNETSQNLKANNIYFAKNMFQLQDNQKQAPKRKSIKINAFPLMERTISGKKLSINDFQMGLRRSQDEYGSIYPAKHIQTEFVLCIKKICKKDIGENIQNLIKSLKNQCLMRSQYCTQIYGIFEQNGYIYVLMQYFQQREFFMKIRSLRNLSYQQSIERIQQICYAVRDAHNKNIIIHNLQSSTISWFLDVCKILILGSGIYQNSQNSLAQIQYLAPEVLQGKQNSKASDIWSLGILIFEIFSGGTPTQNRSRKRAIKQIQKAQFEFPQNFPKYILNLLKKIFAIEPSKRPQIHQIIEVIQMLTSDGVLKQ